MHSLQYGFNATYTPSQDGDIVVNDDGSVDVWFGPVAPEGKEPNWVQTGPGEGWNMLMRLYGPLDPWFDGTWRPGEIEVMERRDVDVSTIPFCGG